MVLAEYDAGIVPSKAEGVGQSNINIVLHLLARHDDAHVDLIFWVVKVDGGMKHACKAASLPLKSTVQCQSMQSTLSARHKSSDRARYGHEHSL